MNLKQTLLVSLRNKFFAGLIILIPIVITAKALWWLFTYVDGLSRPLAQTLAGHELRGIGFALTVAVVLVTGLLFSAGPLRRLLDGLVEVLESVPIVGTVYATIRKVLAGFGSPGSRQAFEKFVFARVAGVLAPGFLTGSFALERADGTEETYRVVFVPSNHLYIGNILVLRDDEVIPTDVSVEDGIGFVLSAGASPPKRLTETRREKPPR
jgi:uncharacterized membrane protein